MKAELNFKEVEWAKEAEGGEAGRPPWHLG